MARGSITFGLLGFSLFAGVVVAQPSGDTSRLGAVAAAPVTDAMLRDPDPADWLMYSRTYDAQRYSPLSQINKSNVGSLALAWSNHKRWQLPAHARSTERLFGIGPRRSSQLHASRTMCGKSGCPAGLPARSSMPRRSS